MTANIVAAHRTPVKVQKLDATLVAMAHYLKQRAVRDPQWDTAFIRALDKGLAHAQLGRTVERANAGYWVAPSATQPFVTYEVNRWHCACPAGQHGRWCWHRALVTLLEVVDEFDVAHGFAADDADFEEDEEQPRMELVRQWQGRSVCWRGCFRDVSELSEADCAAIGIEPAPLVWQVVERW